MRIEVDVIPCLFKCVRNDLWSEICSLSLLVRPVGMCVFGFIFAGNAVHYGLYKFMNNFSLVYFWIFNLIFDNKVKFNFFQFLLCVSNRRYGDFARWRRFFPKFNHGDCCYVQCHYQQAFLAHLSIIVYLVIVHLPFFDQQSSKIYSICYLLFILFVIESLLKHLGLISDPCWLSFY